MAHLLTCRKEMAPGRMAENESCRTRRVDRRRQVLGWNVGGSASRLLSKNRIIRIKQQLARARRRGNGEGRFGFINEDAAEVDRRELGILILIILFLES